MFQFPAFAPDGLCIQQPVTPSACTVATGFPIRRSQDQRSFDSFPGLIAAYRVLHRLITPRHPPYTLDSLTTCTVGPNHPADGLCQAHPMCSLRSVSLDPPVRRTRRPNRRRSRTLGEPYHYGLPYTVVKEPSQRPGPPRPRRLGRAT